MSEDPNEKEKKAVVELYGVKVPAKPGNLGENRPPTWREVARQMHGHLKGFVAGITRLAVEIPESSVRLLRGVSMLPSSIANRIDDAHQRADAAEDVRQQAATATKLLSANSPPISVQQDLDQLLSILQHFWDRGIPAFIRIQDGKAVVMIAVTNDPDEFIRALKESNQLNPAPEDDPKKSK